MNVSLTQCAPKYSDFDNKDVSILNWRLKAALFVRLPHNSCGAMLHSSLRILVAPLIFLPILLRGDQVTLKNGDRISGQIIKKDGDKLTLKSEFLGEVTIPWDAVTGITSDQALAVVIPGDKTITGKVNTTDSKVH